MVRSSHTSCWISLLHLHFSTYHFPGSLVMALGSFNQMSHLQYHLAGRLARARSDCKIQPWSCILNRQLLADGCKLHRINSWCRQSRNRFFLPLACLSSICSHSSTQGLYTNSACCRNLSSHGQWKECYTSLHLSVLCQSACANQLYQLRSLGSNSSSEHATIMCGMQATHGSLRVLGLLFQWQPFHSIDHRHAKHHSAIEL